MPQPQSYKPITDFSNDEANLIAGRSMVRTQNLDTEFSNLQTTLNAVLANIALLQRDDGQQANASIGTEQLKTKLLVGVGATTDWLTATNYRADQLAWQGYILYRCIVSHTSGVFADDLAAKNWLVLIDLSTPVNITNANVAKTTSDAAKTASDKTATNADVAQTTLDRAATNSDVVSTNANAASTANDVLSTAASANSANAAAAQTALDKTATNADATATAADLVQTNLDQISCAANAAATAADKVATNADVVTTTTKAAAASTSEANAANSSLSAGNYAAQAGAAAGIIIDFPTATGAPNYAATLGIAGYTVGKTYRIRILQQNLTTTPTLNLDSLGAINIKSLSGSNIGLSTMLVNAIGDFYYDGINFLFLNPGSAIQPAALNVYLGVAFTVNTYKKITFSAIKVDTLKAFDTLNYKYTPTVSGYYFIKASIRFLNCLVGDVVSIYIRVNAVVKVQRTIIAQQVDPTLDISYLDGFNGSSSNTDVYVYNVTRATSTLSNNAAETRLEIFRVG